MTKINFRDPCLVIDSSSHLTSISVHINYNFEVITRNFGNALTKNIIPTIDGLLKKNTISIANIKCIIYSKGPGAFNSLRIGLAIAKGLSLPFNIPLIGIPKLDVIAFQAKTLEIKSKLILAYSSTTSKNEFFYAIYDSSSFVLKKYYDLSKIDNALQSLNLNDIFAIGDTQLNNFNLKSVIFNPIANDYFNQAKENNYNITNCERADLLYIKNKIALTTKEQNLLNKVNKYGYKNSNN